MSDMKSEIKLFRERNPVIGLSMTDKEIEIFLKKHNHDFRGDFEHLIGAHHRQSKEEHHGN